jgi:hypothetical protein
MFMTAMSSSRWASLTTASDDKLDYLEEIKTASCELHPKS